MEGLSRGTEVAAAVGVDVENLRDTDLMALAAKAPVKVLAENGLLRDKPGFEIEFLTRGHEAGVPIIPMYDTGPNSAELIAELAAINGVDRVLIGSSRRACSLST